MMLSVDRIHTYYGYSHVLRGVSLQIQAGETVALLGRNGVGKSTIVNSIIGFAPPRRGRILLAGANITAWPPHRIARQGVGLVPQDRGIFPTLTARENLMLAARQREPDGWTLDRILALFPLLAPRLAHFGGQLSGGEQQMLAIARALMTNPRLLLLDEPSEGLAPLVIAEIRQIIGQLRRQGLSILLVEQNLRLALDAGDRIYVMSKGEMVFEGTPARLNRQPEIMPRYLGI